MKRSTLINPDEGSRLIELYLYIGTVLISIALVLGGETSQKMAKELTFPQFFLTIVIVTLIWPYLIMSAWMDSDVR